MDMKEMFFDCFLNEYNNILITYFSREIIENSNEEIENNIENQIAQMDRRPSFDGTTITLIDS